MRLPELTKDRTCWILRWVILLLIAVALFVPSLHTTWLDMTIGIAFCVNIFVWLFVEDDDE